MRGERRGEEEGNGEREGGGAKGRSEEGDEVRWEGERV